MLGTRLQFAELGGLGPGACREPCLALGQARNRIPRSPSLVSKIVCPAVWSAVSRMQLLRGQEAGAWAVACLGLRAGCHLHEP